MVKIACESFFARICAKELKPVVVCTNVGNVGSSVGTGFALGCNTWLPLKLLITALTETCVGTGVLFPGRFLNAFCVKFFGAFSEARANILGGIGTYII